MLLHFHNEKVSLEELIKTIVGFSYKGDLRMRMKMENPAKIENLVKGNQPQLNEIYLPLLLEIQENKLLKLDNSG